MSGGGVLRAGQQVVSAAAIGGKVGVASGSGSIPSSLRAGLSPVGFDPATALSSAGRPTATWSSGTPRGRRRALDHDRAHPGAVQALAVSTTVARSPGAGRGGNHRRIGRGIAHDPRPRRARAGECGRSRSSRRRAAGFGRIDGPNAPWWVSDVAPSPPWSAAPGMVEACAFGPDGAVLARGGDDATVRLWDVASHESLAVLAGHTDLGPGSASAPMAAAWSRPGRTRPVILWDVDHRVGHRPPVADGERRLREGPRSACGRPRASARPSKGRSGVRDVDDASWVGAGMRPRRSAVHGSGTGAVPRWTANRTHGRLRRRAMNITSARQPHGDPALGGRSTHGSGFDRVLGRPCRPAGYDVDDTRC